MLPCAAARRTRLHSCGHEALRRDPEGELPHVKEKFYKGSSKNRGTGIGLSVCDEIVTRHGGRLDIDNAPGGGCVVSVSLPMNT